MKYWDQILFLPIQSYRIFNFGYLKFLILLFLADHLSLDQVTNEEHVKKLLASTAAAAVAHSVVSDSLHCTNNNLCHVASTSHLNSLDSQHLGIHGLTQQGTISEYQGFQMMYYNFLGKLSNVCQQNSFKSQHYVGLSNKVICLGLVEQFFYH